MRVSASFSVSLALAITSTTSGSSGADGDCVDAVFQPGVLRDPCSVEITNRTAPESFSLVFDTTAHGSFTADCIRDRAPVWADRVWNMARLGHYNSNYFFRVVPGKFVQFGTNGVPP